MKPNNIIRYILLPALTLAAGAKLGVKYAKDNYVAKDRKFIEGEVVPRHSRESGNLGKKTK